jgi:hypothetical protein
VARGESAPPGIDVTRPGVARVYDYLLGGKDNFAADRELVKLALQIAPDAREAARANRQFLQRVVRFLSAEAGVRQFIDIGSGLPTQGNVHEVAQAAEPGARVVYVDNDPIVLVHARALLADATSTTVVQADARQPKEILESPEVKEFIDFSRPVGLLMLAILHHFNDDEDPADAAAQFRDAMPSGSYVALSHFHNPGDEHPVVSSQAITAEKLFNERLGTGRWRSREELLAYFGDWELIEPGLVPILEWRPDQDAEHIELGITYYTFVGGVARKA